MSIFQRILRGKVNVNLANDLAKKVNDEVKKMPSINILVAGKTGSGKSTLINALFRENIAKTGVGMPVTQHVEKLTKEGVPLTLYDTKGLELTAEAQKEVLKSLAHLINIQKELGHDQEIHLAYYCVNANMSRIEAMEVEIIRALASELPVVLVVTQSIGQESNEFIEYLKELALPIEGVVPVLAKEYAVSSHQKIPAHGLQDLIDITLKIIPSKVHQAFINAQQIDIDRKVEDARRWAKRYIKTSFGVGFTPIPVSDAAILVPMQITMLGHITAIFGLSLEKSQIISMLAGVGGTGGATAIGKYLAGNLLKFIPGVGTITGGVISGMTASSLTIALAYSYIEVLKQIARAEMLGYDMGLNEISKLMGANFNEQLKEVSKMLPDSVKNQLPLWTRSFFVEDY